MRDVVVVKALRTPIGRFNGAFKDVSATALGSRVIAGVLRDSGIEKEAIGSVIMGNVLQAGLGQNPARQAAVGAGLPYSCVAMTINEVCGSGLKAIHLGKQAIQLGEHDIVIVGGFENMTQAPYLLDNVRSGAKYNNLSSKDSLYHDGLMDAFSNEAMGVTAQRVADLYGVSRQEQDLFALKSQKKAAFARRQGWFKREIVAVETRQGFVEADEAIREDTTIEQLSSLRPVFKQDGSVTAGNASTINDGAAALLLMARDTAEQRGITPLATLKDFVEVGIDPDIMGYAPFTAIEKLEAVSGIGRNQIDRFELNEAFASQSVAVIRDLNLAEEKVNVAGGAIALGHPIGASGARIVVSLIHELIRSETQRGMASLCIGGGLGMALMIER